MKIETGNTAEDDLLWQTQEKVRELTRELEITKGKLTREVIERNNYFEMNVRLLKILENLSEWKA